MAHEAGYDPVGSAPTQRTHLVLECAPPWEREVTDSATFPSEVAELLARAAAEGSDARVTGLMPDTEYTQPGLTRVFLYSHDGRQSPVYAKQEYLVPPEQVPMLVEALLFAPHDLQRFSPYRQETEGIREVLVCGHGSRDRCCATFGFEIYRELREKYARSRPDSLRVWRCSHVGGHRMAPTLLDLPEGRYYAFVTAQDLPNLVAREGSFAALEQKHRGWGRLSPLEQVAEHAVMLAEGWLWTANQIECETTSGGTNGDPATVWISYSAPETSRSGSYRVVVREAPERELSFPSSCGKEDEPQPQFVVEHIEKLQ